MENIRLLIEHYNNLGVKLWTDNGQLHFKAGVGVLKNDDKLKLKENKQAIIEYLSAIENKPVEHDEKNSYEPFILTPIQNSYLLGRKSMYDYGGVGCHAYVEVKLTPRCDLNKITKAWHTVIMRHDMLRAVIEKEGIQRVVKDAELPEVNEYYASDESYEKLHIAVRNEMSCKKYESDVYPLHELRVTSCDSFSILHFSMDMLIADSVSASIILSDILRCYYDNDAEIRKPDITFRDVMVYNQSRVSSAKYQIKYLKDMKYWKDRIETLPEEPKLPVAINGKGRHDADFEQLEFHLDNSEWAEFNETAKQNKLTGSSAILAVFAEILGLWSENEHFCINTTTMNRPAIHKQIYEIVGDFTNINLLEINRNPDETFAQRAVKVHIQLWSDLSYSEFNGIDVMHLLNRTRKKQISMPYVYTSTVGIKGLEDSRIDVVYKTSQTPQVFIDCQVAEGENGAAVIWSVRKGVFKFNTAEKMFEQFSLLVNKLAHNPEVWNEKYPCIAPERKLFNNMYVSKDGIHQCYDYVIGRIYDSNGNDTGLCGRYRNDGSIDILGKKENSVEYKGQYIYTDYCLELIRNLNTVKDAYISNNKNKMDIYVIPEKTSIYNNLKFNLSEVENRFIKENNCNLLERETDISNEYSAIVFMELFQKNNIFTDSTGRFSFDDIIKSLKVKNEYCFLVKRWLNALCLGNYIGKDNHGLYYGIETDFSEKHYTIENELKKLISEDENIRMTADYIINSGNSLEDIITGVKSPLELLFPKGDDKKAFSAYNENPLSAAMNRAVADLTLKYAEKFRNRKLRILEAGAGVGGTTEEILKSLSSDIDIEYYFTDISNYFLKLAASRFKQYSYVHYGILDINKKCTEQNVDFGNYDIIIAANVLHNAENGNNAMKNLKEMLAPNGFMIFLDAIDESYSLMISKSILHNSKILDSRAENDRIFYSDSEWKKMFKENNLSIMAEYPENEIMKKSALKVYAVGNSSIYSDVNADDIFETIKDEIGYREVICKTVISQLIPSDKNGNIDKNELIRLTERSKDNIHKNSIVLPETETEKKVADIWKKLLECDEISTDINFFESGGDSLLASMMVTEIKKNIPSAENIEWEKLMQSILQNPTIKDIASMLDNVSDKKDFVVEYQHGCENPSQVWALFVNGTGTMAIYNQLLQLMKESISPNDRIIGLHCGDFNEYIKMPSDKVMNILSDRNAEYLAGLGVKRYNFIGHCFGGGVAIQTAYNLNKMNINNISIVTIDSRRWNVFCDNSLVIERGFAQMMGSDVSRCGHTISDKMLQDNLERFVRKHGRIMSEEEICNCKEIDSEVRECFSRLRKIPQNERLAMMFHETDSPQNKEQEKQFIILYKVFYQCLISFTAFKPDMYSGEVHAVRANDRSNFFIPVENANESDYLRESVTGTVHNYHFDGDHFTCLTDDKNVKRLSEIVLKNRA